MFHIIRRTEEDETSEITQELDRTYNTVPDFVHEVQDTPDDDPEFDLTGVCEAGEVYVVAGEKGLGQDEPRDRGLKKMPRNLRVRQNPQSRHSSVALTDEFDPSFMRTSKT